MKYFILTNGDKNPFPQILNWSQTIDVRKLTRDEYQKIPPFIQLNAKLGMDGIFPDVIVKPFLLLSRPAIEVMALYDPDIPFLFFVLFEGMCFLLLSCIRRRGVSGKAVRSRTEGDNP